MPNTKSTTKKPKTPKKMGRPTVFSDTVADEICGQLAEGKSLRKVCEASNMPAIRTVMNWLRTNENFLQQYTRAKEESADSLADRIQQVSEDVLSGQVDPQAARVAGDLMKWSASKLKPKKYGDKLDLTSDGEKLPTPLLGGLSAQHDALKQTNETQSMLDDAKEHLQGQGNENTDQ